MAGSDQVDVATTQVTRTLAGKGANLAIAGIFVSVLLVGIFAFWPQISELVRAKDAVTANTNAVAAMRKETGILKDDIVRVSRSLDDRIDEKRRRIDALESREGRVEERVDVLERNQSQESAIIKKAITDFERRLALVEDQTGDLETAQSIIAQEARGNTDWRNGQVTRAARRVEKQEARETRLMVVETQIRRIETEILPALRLEIELLKQSLGSAN